MFLCHVLHLHYSFFGAPVLHGGKIIYKTEYRLVIATDMTYDQVLAFHREALNSHTDINFRDWKVETNIEDEGK